MLSKLARPKKENRETIDEPEEPLGDIDLRSMDEDSFLERCTPYLEKLEEIRKLKKLSYVFRKKIALPLVIIGFPLFAYLDYLLLLWQSSSDDSGAGISIMFLAGVYWWVTQPKREYAAEYKKKILPRIARLFGSFHYEINGKIDMSQMKPSKIVPSFTSYKSEDYFNGNYKEVDIEFSEIHLTETRGSGKNRRTVTTFKGLSILLDMKRKKFYGHTIIDRNKSKMGEWFKQKSLKLKRANLVDPEFEKIFDAYTNDQVEARYLIDPTIIEELKNLYEYYAEAEARDFREKEPDWMDRLRFAYRWKSVGLGKQSNKMMVAYYESKVLILIGSDFNHFEPADLHVPATDPQSILHMKQEISDILNLIDKLDLYDPDEVHRAKQEEDRALREASILKDGSNPIDAISKLSS